MVLVIQLLVLSTYATKYFQAHNRLIGTAVLFPVHGLTLFQRGTIYTLLYYWFVCQRLIL